MNIMTKSKKNLYIGFFIIFLLCLFIGSAILGETLKINGTTEIAQNSWNVRFDNVVESGCNTVEVMNHVAKINNDNHKIGFDVAFNDIDDTFDFVVDLVNNGTVDAMVGDFQVTGIPEDDNHLSYSITYLDDQPLRNCDPLYAGKTRKIQISFSLLESEEFVMKEETNYHLTLNIDFVQLDRSVCEIPEYNETDTFDEEEYAGVCEHSIKNKYNLYIDPSKGLYNGSKHVTVVNNLSPGEEYTIGEPPVKDGYTFVRWVPYNNVEYETNYNVDTGKVTMGEKNAYIKAEFAMDDSRRIARINDVYYPTIQAAFDDAVPGDTIYLLDNTTEDSVNELKDERRFSQKKVKFDLGGFTVTGQLVNEDILVLTNGTYINPNGVAVINKGTLDLGLDGEDDDTIDPNDSYFEEGIKNDGIALIGSNEVGGLGLDQRGTFNFYDGYIQGYIGIAGSINRTPAGYYVYVEHKENNETNEEYQKAFLILQPSLAVARTVSDGGSVYYFNLQDCINVATMMGYDVYAVRDFPAAYPVDIEDGEAITFNLAGSTVEFGTDFINNGRLTITDSGQEGMSTKKGSVKLSKSIENNGQLILNNLSLSLTSNLDMFNNKGDLEIHGSTLTTQNGYVFRVEDGSSLTMDQDTYLYANNYAIYADVSGEKTFTIQGGNINGILNKGNLTINENTNVFQNNSVNRAIYYNVDYGKTGLLTINGGTVSVTDDDGGSAIYCDGSGTKNVKIDSGLVAVSSDLANKNISAINGACIVAMNGGEISATANDESTAYALYGTSTTLNDGTITTRASRGTSMSVYGGSINVLGGLLDVAGNDANVFVNTTATTNGGTITVNGTIGAVIYSGSSVGTVNDGELSSNLDCIHITGNKTVNGGTLTCSRYGVANYGTSGTFTMNGGTINSVEDGIYYALPSLRIGYYNKAVMTGGRIVSSNGNGIYFGGDKDYSFFTLNIKASDDSVTNETYPYIEGVKSGVYLDYGSSADIDTVNIIGKTEYGLYLNIDATIGTKDEEISTTLPMIKGDTYGVYVNRGKLNIYDGIFKGQTDGFTGEVFGLADGAELVDSTESIDDVLYNTDYLQKQDNFLIVHDKENGTEFNSLQQAIDSIETSDIIYVTKNHDIKSETVIPDGKSITIDFDGYVLNNTKDLTNNGTLTMNNTSDDSSIGGMTFIVNDPIKNNGVLTINGGNYSNNGNDFINNTGTITITGGTIAVNNTANVSTFAIYNHTAYGKILDVTISGGSFIVNGASTVIGIYNTSDGSTNIVINDGTFDLKTTSTGNGVSFIEDGSYYGSITTEIHNATLNIDIKTSSSACIIGAGVHATIHDGEYTLNNPNGSTYVSYDSNTTINNGTINATAANAYFSGYRDQMTINNGTFTTTGTTDSDFFNSSSYASVVNGGTFTANKKCMTIYGGSKTINGGIFTCGTTGVGDGGSNATFTMTGGQITAKNNTLDFSSTGGSHNISITGGTVISNKAYALYSNSSSNKLNVDADTTNIENGTYPTLHGNTYGIYNNAGTGVVDRAVIIGDTKNGLYTKGNLNIGKNDGFVSNEYPMIRGKRYGLFIEGGLVNVYDGIFKGQNDGYNGTISGLPDGYSFNDEEFEEIDGVEYVIRYLDHISTFLRVGDETFNALQSAIDYIDSTGTIEVIASHDIKTESTIPAGKNIILDVHGYTLIDTKSIINNGTLTLKDLSDETAGGISSSASESFVNNGTLNVVSGHYISTGNTLYKNTGTIVIDGGESRIEATVTAGTYGIYNKIEDRERPVNMTINGGTLYVQGKGNCYGIYNYSNSMNNLQINDATITINGTGTNSAGSVNVVHSELGSYGTVLNTIGVVKGSYEITSLTTSDSYGSGASIFYGTHVNISDGTYSVTAPNGRGNIAQAGEFNITTGTFNIEAKTAVTFDNYAYANITTGVFNNVGTSGAVIFAGSTYSSTIEDGTFTSSHQCADLYSGNLTINNGTFTCGTYGIGSTKASSVLTFNRGTLNTVGNGISITDGNANINGGTIISSHGYGLYSKNSGNNIAITTSADNLSSNKTYIEGGNSGIYINDGKLTLGVEDGTTVSDLLLVTGGEYGVYIYGGTFKYFDGTLKGQSRGYLGTITTIEAGNYIYQESNIVDDVEWITNYLKPDINFIKNLRTNTEYNNLVTALNSADEDDTLQFMDNFQLYYPVEIGENVKVVIDLAGHNFVLTHGLINNGNIKFVNSSITDNSIISSGLNLTIITNNGTLEIEKVTVQNIKSNLRLIVTNDGGLTTLNNVTIDSVNGVYTYSGGETIIKNSTLNASDTAIYDAGTTTVNDSTINGSNYAIYSYTNNDGSYKDLVVNSSGAAYYKYGGSSTITLTNNNFSGGYIYNNGGTSEFKKGTINQYIVNKANMKMDNVTFNDFESLNYYGNYTYISNSSILTLDHTILNVAVSNSSVYANGTDARFNSSHLYAISNSGTLNLIENDINVTKTVNHYSDYICRYDHDEECPYQMYFYTIYNTGTANLNHNDIDVVDVSTQYPGKLNDNYYGIVNVDDGVGVVDSDSITIQGGLRAYGLYDSTSKTTNVARSVSVDVNNVKYGYGLYSQNGLYTLESGDVSVSGTNVYGAYLNNSKLSLGLFDGSGVVNDNVVINDPTITALGTESGIGVKYVDGEFYHYDGKIIGNTAARPDMVNLVETGYESTVYYDAENDYEYCVLEFLETQNVQENENMTVVLNGVYYKTLEDAFSRASTGDVVKLLKSISVDVVNDNNSNFVLDLNRFTLTGTLTNNGVMTLINGNISSPSVTPVVNNGTLYIGVYDSNIVYDNIVIRGISVGIQNNGKTYIYDGNIIGDRAYEGNGILSAFDYQVNEEILDGFDTVYVTTRSAATINNGTVYNYEYSGEEESLSITESGYYRLETWGAQGGDVDSSTIGGYGAYASGIIYLNAGDTLYINVGGKGGTAQAGNELRAIGGYNGGGYSYQNANNLSAAGGGGATHIATSSGILSTIIDKNDVLIVAAGGSGAFVGNGYTKNGNSGGGYIGGHSNGNVEASTQTSGFAFGQGDDKKYNNRTNSTHAGGGGGYYGGIAAEAENGASGGSSYIGSNSLISKGSESKCMYGYGIDQSINSDEYSVSVDNYSEQPTSKKPKAGDGHARITKLSIS